MNAEQKHEARVGKRRRKCYLCKERTPGDLCEFWAGFCEQWDEQDLVTEKKIRYKFRDLHRYSVTVCDDCAARIRLKKHLPRAIAWGALFLACAIGILITWLKAGPSYLITMLWAGAAFGLLVAAIESIWMKRGEWSPDVTQDVLKKVKLDPKYKEKGDTFLTPDEHRALYPDVEDEPLTAEEILARDRTGGY